MESDFLSFAIFFLTEFHDINTVSTEVYSCQVMCGGLFLERKSNVTYSVSILRVDPLFYMKSFSLKGPMRKKKAPKHNPHHTILTVIYYYFKVGKMFSV